MNKWKIATVLQPFIFVAVLIYALDIKVSWWVISTIVSATVVFLLLWYVKEILRKLLFISNHMGELVSDLRNFDSHLENIYQMEMFYGEPVLEDLINHSKLISNKIKDFEDICSLTEEEDLPSEGEFSEEETEEEIQKEER